ncbi:MAG: hypothetical protein GX185_02855 [Tissierellia bacterium]|nr:hypothetical protein [Tissierellia bacterium]
MKLIIAVIQDEFINKVTRALMENDIRVTRLSSTGGFLKSGNTTLFIGTHEIHLDKVIDIIRKECKTKRVNKLGEEVRVGGANIFIINMDKYVRI